jgi:predicted acyl esterase
VRFVLYAAVGHYEVDLRATSIVLRPGHRVRIIVPSSDFPRYDRNPNTGETGVDATKTMPALETIFHDADRASHVVLPVV